jgi:hypothetical protein
VPRPRYPEKNAPLPAPLPPESRTVGQVVAEAIRLYAAHWKLGLAIGVLPALVGALTVEVGGWAAVAIGSSVGALVQTASYLIACGLVGGVGLRTRRALTAYAAGVLVFIPVPLLAVALILPALAWLALVGLVVPVALIEGRTFRRSFGRAVELARADFVHILGGLATLAIVALVSQGVVTFSLREFSNQTGRIASTLAVLVLTPLLFIGAAILYVDQEARWRTRRSRVDVSIERAK